MYNYGMQMSKYDRLLYILNLIRSRKNLNAGLLADECGVSERTIYRDIAALSRANIPIYYENGYKCASGNFLPPLNFSAEEYMALKSALESSPLYRIGITGKRLKSVLAKIEATLSPSVKKEKLFSCRPAVVKIKSTERDGKRLENTSAVIETAIRNSRVLSMNYNAIESGPQTRDVEPYFLAYIQKAFYFVGYCRLRRAIRTFRIDRISEIRLTETKFTPRENSNPAEYFRDSWNVFSGDPVEVEVIFRGRAARVVSLGHHHPGEKITHLGQNRVRFNVTVRGTEEIYRWLMGFGGDMIVIRPTSLADRIKKSAWQILKDHDS